MLVYYLVCLVITLYVLEHYVIIGFHSRTHRLLPLILGLVGVYNFYLIVEYVSEYDAVFVVLKDLLLMQMIFLVMYYIMDFRRIRVPFMGNVALLSIFTVSNILVCTQLNYSKRYRDYIMWFVVISILLAVGFATAAYLKKQISRTEHITYMMLYISLIVPAVAVGLSMMEVWSERIVMPAALAFSCIIYDVLMTFGYMMDTEAMLKSDYYSKCDFPVILFDKDMFYLDANNAARERFAGLLQDIEGAKSGHKYMPYLKSWVASNNKNEAYIDGKYYNVAMQELHVRKQIKGYILQVYDITNQKEEVKDKSIFLANMSHDLRSPLHAIIGGSDIMLSRSELSGRNRIMAKHIKVAGENLLEVVNSILDYSKLEAGKLQLEENNYNFRNLLNEQAEIVSINIDKKPILFKMEVLNDYPTEVIGDRLRVRKIIQNLLSNASKYTKEGEITCRISCQTNENGVCMKVEVEDTGEGISQENQQKIFEEFSSHSSGTIEESTGLGLSIVNQLVELMGGHVEVYSNGICGTTMTVTFFQKIGNGEWHAPEVIKSEIVSESVAAWNQSISPDWIYPEAMILVADDMEVNRQIIREYALPWQVKVDTAWDGLQAIEMAQEKEYQLIILDMNMPVMTGEEAAWKLRKIVNAPIIALSANEIWAEHFDDFIQKPILMEKIKEIFEKYIPESYRKAPPIGEARKLFPGNDTSIEGYIRTLRIYVIEIESINGSLQQLFYEDIDKFRVKVHGIKGISRQLNRLALADNAEVMEMAAKAGHMQYIQDHLDGFIDEINIALAYAKKEIGEFEKQKHKDEEAVGNLTRDEAKLEQLKLSILEGFESYNINQVENAMEQLQQYRLSDKEKSMLKQCEEACNTFDYELGVNIFKNC